MTYTDRGLTEIASGLREAKALLGRKRSDLIHQMGVMEAELSALGKIEASIEAALEVLRAEQSQRENAK